MLKIVYFSLIDWDFIWQRPQHLAERLSLKNDFIYIQPFGLRNLRFSDFQRAFRRFRYLFKGLNVQNGLHIKNLFFIPVIARPITKINSLLLKYQMNFLVDPETIIWVTYPSMLIPDILEGMKYRALVYEMMDDYLNIHPDLKENIRCMEKWFIDKAALVITTSEALAEKANRIKRGVRVRVIGNGVDYHFFNSAPKAQPLQFKAFGKIVGYMGMISDWIDFDLVNYLADNRPDLNFVFVGPIRAKKLPSKKNIHFLGTIDYRKVPVYCNGFDVCLIPFQRGEFADAINPVKLYEYLALGKPVISYYTKELGRYKDVIYFARDKEDFLKNVEIALEERQDGIRELRRNTAKLNDWKMISEAVGNELSGLVST